MIKRIIGILLLMAATAFVGGFKGCKKDNQPNPNNGVILQVYSQTQQRRTPTSPLVASLSGVSDNQLRWIDESLAELSLDIAAQNREHNILPQLSIIYVLHTCTLSPESRTPSFLIRADNYDGSVFDQDPRPGIGMVYAAEYVITDNTPSGQVLANEWVICLSDDEVYFKNAARFGNEHKFLFDWYRAEFLATATHTATSGHPLITPRSVNNLIANETKDVVDFGGNATGRVKQ